MLLKTTFLPLWLASLGASIAIPIQSERWCCPADGDVSVSNLKECICPLSKSTRELDGDLYNYVNGNSVNYKAKRELDGDLYNYVNGDSANYKAKRELDGDLYNYINGDSANYKAKRELDGDLYNYVNGDSVNYKAKREPGSGL